ncbi:MAG TPA: AsnC family transcriptional regulator [Ktedonobacteraceae bacterium]|nr:AsnC family transcriptional regulator [Ktedonobacteraceae bacterium]
MAAKESSLELDDIDWCLLDLLRKNARLTFAELGRQVHLTLAAAAERVRKLEEHGIISGYHVALNAHRLGFNRSSLFARHFHEGKLCTSCRARTNVT